MRGVTLLDFESRSRAKLKLIGGRNYWADPSTEAVCCVLYHVDTDTWQCWLPGEPPPRLDVAVAHNWTGFDRFAAAACGFTWRAELDSAQLARRAGLPGALDALGGRWCGTSKDKAGNALTLSLSRPSRAAATRGQLPPIAPVLDRVVDYCASDVTIMSNCWPRLAPWGDVDPGLAAVDQAINDRGVAIDTDLLAAVRDLLEEYQAGVLKQVAAELGRPVAEVRKLARSPIQFAALTGLPNAQKATIAAELERCEASGETIHPLTRARAALASIIAGKVTAGLGRVSPDGRLRDSLLYYGAHAQPLSEPVHTPRGWTTMGALRVGDVVSGSTRPTCVMAVHPQGTRPVFRVCMSDGASVRCDADHLWRVFDRSAETWRTLRTSELAGGLSLRRGCGRFRYRVPLAAPVLGSSVLPLDPYTLGALLGDGCVKGKTPRFTSADPEIAEWFVLPAGVYLVKRPVPSKSAVHYRLSSGVGGRWRTNPLTDILRGLGLWGRDSFTKFIPGEYLRAAPADRLALLQGLLDTDGCARSAGVARYATCSGGLRDAVVELVRSLGGVARVRVEPLNGGVIYSVEVRLPAELPAFRLQRKLSRFVGRRVPPSRSIVSIEPDGAEECQCIEVDAADHLYVTRDYVLTHNTGRWSGKGMQLHNLTRTPEFHGDAAGLVRRLVRAAKRRTVPRALLAEAFPGIADPWPVLFSVLVRAALHAPGGDLLAVLDYSGIEARVNAWQAGDRKALRVFRAYDDGTGPDPYCVMASGIFGRAIMKADKAERQVGKAAELGCGYQMGGAKFADTAAKAGTDLAAQGVDAIDVVSAWRELHAPIRQSWYALERGFVGACEGRDVRVGPFTYMPCGDDVVCILPSGRPVVYPEARAKRVKRTLPSGTRIDAWDMTYVNHKGHREHVYGGKFCENNVQAVSRDLLADALVRAEAAGLAPVLHVHDEVVCQVPGVDALGELREIMTDPPSWAKGLPVSTSGFCERRYRK